jgi:hypothetical protein
MQVLKNFSGSTVIGVASLLSGCVTISQSTPLGRYLTFTTGGTVVVEVDSGDSATCSVSLAAAAKKNPQAAGMVRCDTTSQGQGLPVSAIFSDAITAVPFPARFRTLALCQNFLVEMAKPDSGVSLLKGCS